jgi:hypothetical protein
MKKEKLEERIEALLLVSEITIHEPTRKEIVKDLNFYNLEYLKRYGESYKPKER